MVRARRKQASASRHATSAASLPQQELALEAMQLCPVEAFARAVHQGQGFGQHAQAFLDLSFPAQGFGQQGEEVGPVRLTPGGHPGGQSLAQLGNAAGPRPLLGQGPPTHDQAAR